MSTELQKIMAVLADLKASIDRLEDSVAKLSSTRPYTKKPSTQPKVPQNLRRGHVLSFGKHKGKTLGVLLDTDRSYVEWLNEKHEAYTGKLRGMLGSESTAEVTKPAVNAKARRSPPDSKAAHRYEYDTDYNIPF